MYTVQQRDVPEQVVLTEQRHVKVPELATWLPAAKTRLAKAAQALGGAAGPAFVIYHGEVNQDSDGPVEVCVPMGSAQEAPAAAAGTPTRREPAHREAYVRITKAQFDFPQILSAYDAVAQWISAHGRRMAGSPREVTFADVDAAGPNDDVCDVAFPIA
jgi:hypothetical protein